MAELQQIATGPGLVFDAFVDGPADGPLVLMLHGASESFHMWRAPLPALAAAGFRAVAPSQRGYSAGARPPTDDLAGYAIDLLIADAMAIAAACGTGERRFHLVGHDWGGSIAWGIADKHPDRLASLAVRRGRIRPPSIARSRCRTASRRSVRAITRRSSRRTPARNCSPTVRGRCASAGPVRACRRARSRRTSR
jgi:pimeloyl-ACP methyl ester carboxylesterase